MEGKTLVAYFSAEGTTKEVAKVLTKELKADLVEIEPLTPYSEEDLNWMSKTSRSSIESKDESIRPPLKRAIDVSNYDNILVGFPIWWYIEPRIIDTFIESQSFNGKTIIPFATSGGSGISKAEARLKSLCPLAIFKEGRVLNLYNAKEWAKTL